MSIYFFMSEPDHEKFGFTPDPAGANLPSEFAPWEAAGSISIKSVLTDDVRAAIERDGFCLTRHCPSKPGGAASPD